MRHPTALAYSGASSEATNTWHISQRIPPCVKKQHNDVIVLQLKQQQQATNKTHHTLRPRKQRKCRPTINCVLIIQHQQQTQHIILHPSQHNKTFLPQHIARFVQHHTWTAPYYSHSTSTKQHIKSHQNPTFCPRSTSTDDAEDEDRLADDDADDRAAATTGGASSTRVATFNLRLRRSSRGSIPPAAFVVALLFLLRSSRAAPVDLI